MAKQFAIYVCRVQKAGGDLSGEEKKCCEKTLDGGVCVGIDCGFGVGFGCAAC